MLHGFLSELKKARRRHDLLLIAGTALVILAWVAYTLCPPSTPSCCRW